MIDDPRKLLASIIETLYKQNLILSSMTQGFNDLVMLTFNNLPKCQHTNCENPTTFKKKAKESAQFICDRHLAEGILNKTEAYDEWVEVDCAESIRSLIESSQHQKSLFEVTLH
jgi:hypothetical protein